MKRLSISLIGSLLLAGLVAAQASAPGAPPQSGQPALPRGHMPRGWLAQNPPQAASLEGTLAFVDQRPVLQAKDRSYLFAMPRFWFYAYTDAIKAGAAIKADGFLLPTLPGQDKAVFVVTKAVINGKTYDFTTGKEGWGRRLGAFHRGMMGGDFRAPGRGGYGR